MVAILFGRAEHFCAISIEGIMRNSARVLQHTPSSEVAKSEQSQYLLQNKTAEHCVHVLTDFSVFG